ncbi:type II secretion system F family protein [Shimia biformata]|uniref:type II secretion system F family protein n=1 Tax=Shimia biformata TaxID=1294299 RepID=UPI0030843A87
MKAYRYTAYTDSGRMRRGAVVAETEAAATAELAARGLFVSELDEKPPRPARWRRGALNRDLQMVMTRQLAVLLGAELPADDALEAVRLGGDNALETVAARARAALLDGAPLSAALEGSGAGFPPYYIAALRAGEDAGDLAAVFSELADHLETIGSDRAQIGAALVYPAFVAAVSFLVAGILMTTVAPEIVAMFELTGRPLPELTRVVMAASDWIRNHAVLLSGFFVVLVLLMVLAARVPPWRRASDQALLRLPLVGRLMSLGAAVQYMRTLALVLGSRHAVITAAQSAAEVLTVPRLRTEGDAVVTALGQGESLTDALNHMSIIPPVARQLIGAGETSVRLAPMTARAADMVENSLSLERKRIAALLEPMLMMVVGGFVLLIVLAVLLPIFDLQAVVAG